jgi:3-oxoacyl-[acyl-carrier protein] reductase
MSTPSAPTTPFTLAGRNALVTGGSRGIGAAVSRLLAQSGANVCVGYHSRRSEAVQMVAQVAAFGVKAAAHASDISTAAGAASLVEHATRELGTLEVLVHSAGIWPVEEQPVAELEDARWASTMRQNTDAMFFVTRAAARAMMSGRRAGLGGYGGRIVLVSSTAGQRGEAMHADYAASKGAMISFVKSMAVEVAEFEITVNAVAPGWVDTEMCELPFRDGGKERIAKAIPVRRIATPDDIAFPIVCLCFPGSRHVTGEIVNVNGGSVLCG